MAIDTAQKRRSISGIPMLIPGVTPTATPDAAWRQEAGWSYSGILATGALADIVIALQIDDGGGFVDVLGTKRHLDLASGFGNIGFGVITDVQAGDKLRVRWERVSGATTYTIYPTEVCLNVKYLDL